MQFSPSSVPDKSRGKLLTGIHRYPSNDNLTCEFIGNAWRLCGIQCDRFACGHTDAICIPFVSACPTPRTEDPIPEFTGDFFVILQP
jgi:hypothetical protein